MTMGYATYQEMLDRLCEIRDGDYRSDPERDAARFASLESIMQALLEKLRHEFPGR
jgi:hypothetical protein